MKARTIIRSSDRRYQRMVAKCGYGHKHMVNAELARLFREKKRALVLDDKGLGTSKALLGTRPRRGMIVTVANPCAASFASPLVRGVRLLDSTVEEVILRSPRRKFDLIYLDFCSKFSGCFDTVESSVQCLANSGILAYTVCNRGVSREQIAFNALRHRDVARTNGLALIACVAYRDMVTIIMTLGASILYKTESILYKYASLGIDADADGHYAVKRFRGWRVHLKVLQLKVEWTSGELTWEPASTLVQDLDRATFVRLIHDM